MEQRPSTEPDSEDAAFYADLMKEDELGRIIRAHLHIENQLSALILKAAVYPKAIADRRWPFDHLIRMAVAMGLHEDFLEPLLKFNKVRNEFAHDVERKLSIDDFNTIWSVSSAFIRDTTKDAYKRTSRKISNPPFYSLPFSQKFTLILVSLRGGIKVARLQLHEMQQCKTSADLLNAENDGGLQ
jgi:hypothetical protein